MFQSTRARVAGWCSLAICSGILGFLVHTYTVLTTAPQPNAPKAAQWVVEIPEGAGLRQISEILHQQGLVSYPRLLRLAGKITGKGSGLRAGEHSLSAALSPWQILEALRSGPLVLHRLTVPEGYTLSQIAKLVASEGWCPEDTFLAAAQETKLWQRWEIPRPDLEGYLFPETYYFAKGVSPREIVQAMLAQFDCKFTKEMESQAQGLGLTGDAVVTLASLIEREGGGPAERGLISAVYHNRLKKGMLLQCDPTVIYALKDFSGNLTRDNLELDSPYNTYRYRGLPPGPIANPGVESLAAALYPEAVDYLYFVSRNDGTHQFSSNLREHNRAVNKYQKQPRKITN